VGQVGADAVEGQPHGFGAAAREQPTDWCQSGDERDTNEEPCRSPSPELHEGTDHREGDHETDAEDDAVDRHCQIDLAREPMADHGDADHRQGALAQAASERQGDGEHPEVTCEGHRTHHHSQGDRDRREHAAGAEAIDQAADADGEQGTDQRRPQVHLSVVNASDLQVGDQRLGDQA
jgi:hypothetical protein